MLTIKEMRERGYWVCNNQLKPEMEMVRNFSKIKIRTWINSRLLEMIKNYSKKWTNSHIGSLQMPEIEVIIMIDNYLGEPIIRKVLNKLTRNRGITSIPSLIVIIQRKKAHKAQQRIIIMIEKETTLVIPPLKHTKIEPTFNRRNKQIWPRLTKV